MTSTIKVDTISEKTSANGVAIDSVTLKDGGIAATAASTITTADNTDTLTLTSTDADAAIGPNLRLYRNSSSPADDDLTATVDFEWRNDNSQDVIGFQIDNFCRDVSDGAEENIIRFKNMFNGTLTEFMRADSQSDQSVVTFNELSNDIDFRVESNGNTNMLFVDAGNDKVGIGTSSPQTTLHVEGTAPIIRISDSNSTSEDDAVSKIQFYDRNNTDLNAEIISGDGSLSNLILSAHNSRALVFQTNGNTERMRITNEGRMFVNRTTSNQNDHDSGRKERFGVTETSAAKNSMYLSNTSASFSSYHQRNDATRAAHVGYGFFIGSSGNESDNEIRMMGDGSINSDGSNNLGSGADYAEYFEWKDGNSSDENRRGYSVVLDGNQIVKATDSDDASKIIGVISGNPAVVGDSAWNKWNQKHLKDDFNTYIWEDYTQTEWTDADGNFISHQTDLIPDGVTVPDDAVVVSKEDDGTTNLQRRKVNPSWDATATYIPRSDRKEWDTVGLMGKLRLKKGQPTGTNWIKMRDISDTVEEWLVR